MSNAARGLLDDLTSRRQIDIETPFQPQTNPFPDLDHTLDILTGDNGSFGGFGFNLDPKLAMAEDDLPPLPNMDYQAEAEAEMAFNGNFLDAFPALRQPGTSSFMAPPGIPYTHNPTRAIYDPMATRSSPSGSLERQSTGGSSGYVGSFNPFSDNNDSAVASSSYIDDDRKVSRFGFARGRRGSNMNSSPGHVPSPLSNGNDTPYMSTSISSDLAGNSAQAHWGHPARPEYGYPTTAHSTSNPSNVSSPHVQHSLTAPHAHAQAPHPSSRFQPFDNPTTVQLSEARVRDLMQSNQSAGLSRLQASGRIFSSM